MRTPTPLILLPVLAALLVAAPAATAASSGVARIPSGKKVGSLSASATRTSKTVTVKVKLNLKVAKAGWKAGVLVSLLCGDRSLGGGQKTIRFTGKGTSTTKKLTATIKVPAGRCSVKRRVVTSVLLSRTAANAVTYARGQAAFRA